MTKTRPTDPDYAPRALRFFADLCRKQSPLYAELASRVAEDPEVLALLVHVRHRQPLVNMLMGAVHYILLSGVQHPLAEFYPSVGGIRPPGESYPAFADFCRGHEREITTILSTRRVQTNEVGRCGLLLPAFGLAQEWLGDRPLDLVEIGASLGLNLAFDRYAYDYGTGPRWDSGAEAPAIRTEILGETPVPLPERLPSIASRVGIDLAPQDVRNEDPTRWVESLIWADELDRLQLFRRAVAVVRRDPPRLLEGDALAVLPDVLAGLPPDAAPCVVHSHATYQMKSAWRDALDALLAREGRRRPLIHVSLEWLGDDPGPRLHLSLCGARGRETVLLAECDHHGRWIRWVAEAARPPGGLGASGVQW